MNKQELLADWQKLSVDTAIDTIEERLFGTGKPNDYTEIHKQMDDAWDLIKYKLQEEEANG
tara:strand:- start:324 stop:506 length:183 start_codon:yes stop_codon:yes gene_type:complete